MSLFNKVHHKSKWLFAIFAILVSSCGETPAKSQSSSQKEDTSCSVYLQPNDVAYGVLTDNPIKVERGDTATFSLKMKSDYFVKRIARKGEIQEAEILSETDGTVTISIPNIRYSAIYETVLDEAFDHIHYYPNGGDYIDGSDNSLPYDIDYSLQYRFRPNTQLGNDRMTRVGYVLSGWNTSPDGSGEHVGLGSRVTIPENHHLSLYAQWEKESPAEDFTVSTSSLGIRIESYLGNDEKVVVPMSIDSLPVTRIASGTFHGNEKVVILPPTISVVSKGAFTASQIEELYFYDSVEWLQDTSFADCPNFSTIHINAILAPRYGKDNLWSEINFCDKYDILILNKDKKKLIVFGGSGAYNSIVTKQIQESLNDGYFGINMAVNGWFNGVAQVEMMLPYLKEGDLFIHAPETSSQFGMFYSTTMTPEVGDFTYNKYRLYCCLESNYDLLSLVDFRHVDGLLTGFDGFNNARRELEETTYDDYKTVVNLYGVNYENDLGYMDEHGDFALPKVARAGEGDAGEADIVVEYVTREEGHSRLNSYYEKLRNKGVDVFFTPAAINEDTLRLRLENPELFDRANESGYLYYGRPPGIPWPNYEDIPSWINAFETAVKEYLSVEMLLPLSQSLYHNEDYFEPDYHLHDGTAPLFTQKIIDALKAKGYGGAA